MRGKIGISTTLIILLVSNCLYGQFWDWAKVIGSSGDETIHNVTIDPSTHDIYVVGKWAGNLSAIFEYQGVESSNFSVTYGETDGFVAKYDTSGRVRWAFRIGGVGADDVVSVKCDNDNHIYISGSIGAGNNQFSGTVSLTPDSTISNTSNTSSFLAKYTTAGELIWVNTATSETDIAGREIYVSDSSVYQIGNFTTSISIGPITRNLALGSNETFAAKYTLSGEIEWLILLGSSRADKINGILADGANMYIMGTFSGGDFIQYDKNFNKVSASIQGQVGREEIFLSCFSIEGLHQWSQRIYSNNSAGIRGITATNESLIVTGGITDSTFFPGYTMNPVRSTGGTDIFISSHAKTNGNTNWAVTVPSSDILNDYGSDIELFSSKQMIVTGTFSGELDFMGQQRLTAASDEDIFVASYTTGGEFLWAERGSGQGKEYSYGVAVGSRADFYFIGNYIGDASFGAITLPFSEVWNGFVSKGTAPVLLADAGSLPTTDSVVCVNETVQLSLAYANDSIIWQKQMPGTSAWSTIGHTDTLILHVVISDSAKYRAIVQNAASADTSNTISVLTYAMPNALILGDTTICPTGAQARLTINLSGMAPWEFTMNKGNGTDTLFSLIEIPDLIYTTADSGQYAITRMHDAHCESKISALAQVAFHSLSDAVLSGDTTICEGGTAQLNFNITGNSPWNLAYTNQNDTLTLTDISSTPFQLPILPITDEIYHIVSVHDTNNCAGTYSGSATIQIDSFPVIRTNRYTEACGLTITTAFSSTSDNNTWTQLSGEGISRFLPDEQTLNPTIEVDTYGRYVYTITAINGKCKTDSIVDIDYVTEISVFAGADKQVCGQETVLDAYSSNGSGKWSLITGNSMPIFTDTLATTTLALPDKNFDTYVLKWQATQTNCPNADTVAITFVEQPEAMIGGNIQICGTECFLNAQASSFTQYWTIPDTVQGIELTDLSIPTTQAKVSTYGQYPLWWRVENQGCIDSALLVLDFYEPAIANAGTDTVITNTNQVQLNALANEHNIGTWTVLEGDGILSDTLDPQTSLTDLSEGIHRLQWTVSNPACSSSDEVEIRVQVLDFPSVITPNGDSKNDYFLVPGIENYRNIELIVLNRAGNIVYKDDAYQNNWNGIDKNGRPLLNGTYFYLLKIDEAIHKGYLIINK